MKTIILPIIFCLSCVGTSSITGTSGLSQAELSAIPKGATEVIIHGQDRNELYERIVNTLIQRGHRINREDKDRFYLTTEGKDVGESTLQRMTIVVSERDFCLGDCAEAVIRTEWMPGMQANTMATAFSGLDVTSTWETAKYEVSRLGIAFAESVAVAKATGGVISYR